jgi:hypothetical protein
LDSWSRKKKLACLLCFNDRYGSGKAMNKIPSELAKVLKIIKLMNDSIKIRFASRTNSERVQMQRPLVGESLLSITAPENTRYSKSLNGLLVLAQDTNRGVKSLRVKNMDSIPYKLSSKIQPDQPTILKKRIVCTKINKLLSNIFGALNNTCSDKEINDFVKDNLDLIHKIGFKKGSQFTKDMEYSTFIAPVIPGKQIIMWQTWHATGGADDTTAKITTFLDLCPLEFLSPELQKWYRYVCENAPYDGGAGSARGAWNSFVGLSRANAKEYGIPQAKTKQWVQKSKNPLLSKEDLNKFKQDGYLVVNIPKELQKKYPADETIQQFDEWFGLISETPNFQFSKDIEKVTETGKKDNYKYYTDKIDVLDPFNPEAHDKICRKSHNPQAGGKMIPNDSGMGPGTTYLNCPLVLGFEFSNWVTDLFSSFPFYQDKDLIRLLGRFRVKMKAKWAKSAHVDISAYKMIPE